MGAYDDSLGSMLIGSLLSSVLYGVVITQAYEYFSAYPTDGMYRKGLALSTLFFCTVNQIADYANVYMPMVTFWGNTAKVQNQYWPVPLLVTTSTFVGVLVNSFLIRRFYLLSKNLLISVLLSLLLITGFAGSFMVAIAIQEFSLYTLRDKAKTAVLIWTISTAATDIGIAGALIWQLLSMKSYCSVGDTRSFISRLIIRTVQTGSTTSVVAIITLGLYLHKNDSNIPTACSFLVAPFYALTLLVNLNLRQRDTISVSGRSISQGSSIRISEIRKISTTLRPRR
ncbi:hypothetical protein DFH08DRAFT_346490 [Mycena albidolilacea]|uniref:DUF6534 domain-containing protein n=1 Tax=Mycena albidolilacea TaxID=1033008 RepID=A0AAD6ZI97_9AGAR|nr:hypothetical protein DFH08DRAFT_346490 [Mycena albidolilacea]